MYVKGLLLMNSSTSNNAESASFDLLGFTNFTNWEQSVFIFQSFSNMDATDSETYQSMLVYQRSVKKGQTCQAMRDYK